MTNINRINREIGTNPINTSRAVDKKAIKDNFKTQLGSLEQEEIRTRLEAIYGDIESQTKKLESSLFIEDLIQYKKLVQDFLHISVNNSHIFYKENSLDRRGRHRIFSLVKKVDLELDRLTQDFLDVESNRIHILERLDAIAGILIDILT